MEAGFFRRVMPGLDSGARGVRRSVLRSRAKPSDAGVGRGMGGLVRAAWTNAVPE